MNLEIIPLAQRDIAEVAYYYNEQQPGLDQDFLQEVDATVEQICSGPLRFEQVKPGIRRCLLNRFPYGIYFRMPDENTVRIIVVRHHSRRPGFRLWRT